MKVCDKTCIFCCFPIVSKYLCMAKRSLPSERLSSFRPLHLIIFLIPAFISRTAGVGGIYLLEGTAGFLRYNSTLTCNI